MTDLENKGGARRASGALGAIARLAAYASHAGRVALRRPDCFRPGDLLRQLPAWWASQDGHVSEEIPWLCFSAIELLDRYLRPEMRVFEWGSGGSTLFFSRRVSRVWSVEHDPEWHREVRSRLERAGVSNCELTFVEPEAAAGADESDPSNPLGFASGDARFRRSSFERYVNAISTHADGSLDLVLIDGRARPSCCRAAIPKVRVGGYVVLDNAEVPYYRRAREQFGAAAWALKDVFGPLPGVRHFSETCLWRRIA
jgi:predicted O-methyltransferase YrrM